MQAVGKTTLLNALHEGKVIAAPNISTNGVQIKSFELFNTPNKKAGQGVSFNVWDFGGQAVFHATHQFFMTCNAIYLVLYDMTKPDTRERLK